MAEVLLDWWSPYNHSPERRGHQLSKYLGPVCVDGATRKEFHLFRGRYFQAFFSTTDLELRRIEIDSAEQNKWIDVLRIKPRDFEKEDFSHPACKQPHRFLYVKDRSEQSEQEYLSY